MRLDGPRRHHLQGGGPEGPPALRVLPDRGAGPHARALSDQLRIDAAHPVRGPRAGHRVPEGQRVAGRQPHRPVPRRRREVRRLAQHPQGGLRERLARSLLQAARGPLRLDQLHHRPRLPDGSPSLRPDLPAQRDLRADAGVGPAPRRGQALRRGPRPAQRAPRQLPARGHVAQLPGALPREQQPPQEDAPGRREGRGRRSAPRGPGRPLAGPVQRSLLARGVRRPLLVAPALGELPRPAQG
ncbi:hypothetical protein D3C86_1407890 [compost metagenome]